MEVPRHFVPHPGSTTATRVPGVVAHALDALSIRSRLGLSREWVVGLDDHGRLTAQPAEPAHGLLPAVRSELAFADACGRVERTLEVESLFLFEAHVLAHAPDLPGVNDPIYLHGALVGPLLPDSVAPTRTEGRLTITRADILYGLVSGATTAFGHADTVTGRTTRTFHMLLPADRPAVISEGHGTVLAYPLVGDDPGAAGPGNEPLVDQMLYNVLTAIWRDVSVENPPPLHDVDDLPVPSRAAHEWKLVAEGFTIKGDKAIRKPPGRLRALFVSERRRLPPQGSTDIFLDLAREALTFLPGWPPPRVEQLAPLVELAGPVPVPVPVPAPALVTKPDASPPSPRELWIQQFIEAQDREMRLRQLLQPPPDDEDPSP